MHLIFRCPAAISFRNIKVVFSKQLALHDCSFDIMTESSSPYASSSAGSSPSKHITVVDVYELAASINQDFEKIAELNGRDSIQRLVGKVLHLISGNLPVLFQVISALETLEALAKHNDEGNAEILDLQRTVARLEQEKHLRLKDKSIFEKVPGNIRRGG